jgi:hypothetical protein
MKTKLLTILAFAVLTTTGAQTLFTVHDYDNCKTLSAFGNAANYMAETPVANPDASDTSNPNVTKCTPLAKNASVSLGLPYSINVAAQSNSDKANISFRYYSPTDGAIDAGSGRLVIKLFNRSTGGAAANAKQIDIINKVGGSWQTITGEFDLDGTSQAVIDAGGYDSILFQLNNANAATTPTNDPVFIDDVALNVNPNLSDVTSDLLTGNSWIANYSPNEINKSYEQIDLVVEENVATPSTDGNDSPTVMKITRGDAANPYLKFKIDPINYTTGGKVKFRIFPECKIGVPTNVRFFLRKDDLGATQVSKPIISVIPNIWNEIEVDLATLAGNPEADNIYNDILIFFNFGDESTEAVNTIFYLDAFQAPTAAVLSTENIILESGLKLLGNPVNRKLSLSKEANTLRIYTITGKTVLSYNSKNSNYNVSSLSKGIYFAEAIFDSGKKVFKFIKE